MGCVGSQSVDHGVHNVILLLIGEIRRPRGKHALRRPFKYAFIVLEKCSFYFGRCKNKHDIIR